MGRSRVYCGTFPEPGCCMSCHDDFDEHGMEMVYVDFDGGAEAHVCCQVAKWIDNNRDEADRLVTADLKDTQEGE